MRVCFTLSLLESNIHSQHEYDFNSKHAPSKESRWFENWGNRSLKLSDLHQLRSLTFQCQMHWFHHSNESYSVIDPAEILTSVVPYSPSPNSYTWRIEDPVIIKKMCAAPNVHGFSSPIFEMHGFKWYLTVYPNGSKTNRKGQVNVNLNLASVPNTDLNVMVRQKLYFGRKSIEYLTIYHSERTSLRGVPFGDDEYSTEEMAEMKWLCFTAEIALIETRLMRSQREKKISNDVTAVTDVSIPIYLIEDHESSQEYGWSIEKNVEYSSPLWTERFLFYGLSWRIWMNHDGQVILSLNDRDLVRDHTLCIRFVVSLPDFGTRVITSGYFGRGKKSKDWGKSKIDLMQLQEVVTVQLQMEMMDILPTVDTEVVEQC